jgi:hypothetical protein
MTEVFSGFTVGGTQYFKGARMTRGASVGLGMLESSLADWTFIQTFLKNTLLFVLQLNVIDGPL